MDALRGAVDNIFYGTVIVPLGLALILFQLVMLVVAIRRRKPGRPPLSRRLHAIAGLSIVPLPVLVGFSIHAARMTMLAAFVGADGDPSEKATAIARGISGQLNALPFATTTITSSLALWFAGLAATLGAPRPGGHRGSFPPLALVAAGFAPLALGVVNWSTRLIKTFAALMGVPPADKGRIIEGTLEAARADLTVYARLAMIAIPVLTVAAGVLTVLRDRGVSAESDASAAAGRSWRWPLLAATAALLLAGLLVREARPMAAENAMPWPPNRGNELSFPSGAPTPDLVGPDEPERAPVVDVFRDRQTLDGRNADFEELESLLGTLRNNFKLLHPDLDFNEMALLETDPATPMARVAAVLRAVRGAWYHKPMLVFAKKETYVRPVLGKVERVVLTGAQLTVAFANEEPDEDEAAAWKAAVELRLQDFADYAAFARRLVDLRRAGKPVIVKVARYAD
jgi:hypothetical protein